MSKQLFSVFFFSLLLSFCFTQNCVGSLSDDLIQAGTVFHLPRDSRCIQSRHQWQINIGTNPSPVYNSKLRLPVDFLYIVYFIQPLSTFSTTPLRVSTSP